ncbi:unnamed protein product [Didymodactylos carnosus]|uniref:Uncharacterized protein n=1 Tax=Didymodactylos carnosus TaxID=1234261 RepID=A0A814ENC0_9BILA|nr:unnamed protein product [Didymodactylos carnosus]CAF1036111.1 unnamed protein product [Didymodactylos carnosus]CAF3747476.1 unnamed protein product [Didymodactylos carnosus]CAF3804381.1 unnamed protein product [Didymodactylos carnosus]
MPPINVTVSVEGTTSNKMFYDMDSNMTFEAFGHSIKKRFEVEMKQMKLDLNNYNLKTVEENPDDEIDVDKEYFETAKPLSAFAEKLKSSTSPNNSVEPANQNKPKLKFRLVLKVKTLNAQQQFSPQPLNATGMIISTEQPYTITHARDKLSSEENTNPKSAGSDEFSDWEECDGSQELEDSLQQSSIMNNEKLVFVKNVRPYQKEQYRTDIFPLRISAKRHCPKETTTKVVRRPRQRQSRTVGAAQPKRKYPTFLQGDKKAHVRRGVYPKLRIPQHYKNQIQNGKEIILYVAATVADGSCKRYIHPSKGFLTHRTNPNSPLENPAKIILVKEILDNGQQSTVSLTQQTTTPILTHYRLACLLSDGENEDWNTLCESEEMSKMVFDKKNVVNLNNNASPFVVLAAGAVIEPASNTERSQGQMNDVDETEAWDMSGCQEQSNSDLSYNSISEQPIDDAEA